MSTGWQRKLGISDYKAGCPIIHGVYEYTQTILFGVWTFEEGSIVLLGGSSRLVKVLGVCGVGINYFKTRLEELGIFWRGEVVIHQMIVSFSPTMFSSPFSASNRHVFGQSSSWWGIFLRRGEFLLRIRFRMGWCRGGWGEWDSWARLCVAVGGAFWIALWEMIQIVPW